MFSMLKTNMSVYMHACITYSLLVSYDIILCVFIYVRGEDTSYGGKHIEREVMCMYVYAPMSVYVTLLLLLYPYQ
jgi:hypothetical protein